MQQPASADEGTVLNRATVRSRVLMQSLIQDPSDEQRQEKMSIGNHANDGEKAGRREVRCEELRRDGARRKFELHSSFTNHGLCFTKENKHRLLSPLKEADRQAS